MSFNNIVTIVTGSRRWARPDRVHLILDSYMPRVVVEGNCPGAAHHARQWVTRHGLQTRSYSADFRYYKELAEFYRNRRMLRDWCQHPDVRVLAFLMDGDDGSHDCVRQAMALGMIIENYGDVKL